MLSQLKPHPHDAAVNFDARLNFTAASRGSPSDSMTFLFGEANAW